jgi:hypothetical protein
MISLLRKIEKALKQEQSAHHGETCSGLGCETGRSAARVVRMRHLYDIYCSPSSKLLDYQVARDVQLFSLFTHRIRENSASDAGETIASPAV